MSFHKPIHSKPFSQEQRDVIQMVSAQLGKKDVIIFGYFGSGKTLIAAEVVKIKVDQQNGRKKEVELHAFVFHDKLNQLKSDIKKKWLCSCKMTNVTDIKKFIEQFSNRYELKPEHQSQLEEYTESAEEFKATLQSLASRMNQSGKTHIILIDEVDLKNVIFQDSSKEKNLELDLSYISEYENIHFILCLRPANKEINDFTLSFPSLQSNQYFVCLGINYRNTEAIQRLIKYFQSQIDTKSEGYALMGDISLDDMLPHPLIPLDYNSSVIWVPTIPSVEDEALEKIYSLLLFEDLDELQDEGTPSVAILYTNKLSKNLARKLIQKNVTWHGPLEDVNYNGSEADVVVIISDDNLNIQTLARARRLLIILTLEKEWYHCANLSMKLEKTNALGITEIMRLKDCPYGGIICEGCQSKFDFYHIHEQCHVKCQNFWKGCEWKGLIRLMKNHIEEDCIYEKM